MDQPGLQGVFLVRNVGTTVEFDDATFDVELNANRITVSRGSGNQAVIRQVSGEFASESSIEGGLVLNEETRGEIDYSPYFGIFWEESTLPELTFRREPKKVVRRYPSGKYIELGLDEVSEYKVDYSDGVEATFSRREKGGFNFSFSTGFYGSCWKDADESYTLRFKGDRLKPAEDAYRSQSKFIVSRSKYSGNLILILQEDATVTLA